MRIEITKWEPYRASARFWMVLSIVLGLLAIFISLVALHCSRSAVDVIYEQFNHMRVWEDGSYSGEMRDGTPVVGCIPNAVCSQ